MSWNQIAWTVYWIMFPIGIFAIVAGLIFLAMTRRPTCIVDKHHKEGIWVIDTHPVYVCECGATYTEENGWSLRMVMGGRHD